MKTNIIIENNTEVYFLIHEDFLAKCNDSNPVTSFTILGEEVYEVWGQPYAGELSELSLEFQTFTLEDYRFKKINKDGINSILGVNWSIYVEIQKKYLETYAKLIQEFETALHTTETKDRFRVTHTSEY